MFLRTLKKKKKRVSDENLIIISGIIKLIWMNSMWYSAISSIDV